MLRYAIGSYDWTGSNCHGIKARPDPDLILDIDMNNDLVLIETIMDIVKKEMSEENARNLLVLLDLFKDETLANNSVSDSLWLWIPIAISVGVLFLLLSLGIVKLVVLMFAPKGRLE